MIARKLTGVFTFIAVLNAEFNAHDRVSWHIDRWLEGRVNGARQAFPTSRQVNPPGLCPPGEVSRFGRVAKLAGGVAGWHAGRGCARQLRAGNRPRRRDLLLTPANARRVADQFGRLCAGAAMKLGQILSMDTGDLLPRELADILARLRF